MNDETDLTIQELQAYRDAIIGKDFDAPKLLPIRITEQLIAAMQENTELKAHPLKLICEKCNVLTDVRSEYSELEVKKDE